MPAESTAHRSPAGQGAGNAQRWALRLLLWIPLSPVVGFVIAGRWLSSSWPLGQVAPMAIVLAAPFGIGAYLAFRAVRRGARREWIVVMFLHGVLMVLALAVPIGESLAGP
jgi:hypothetical protein